ncbi:hypothetical protein OIY81_3132 [Cryptosporidium canis]|uniref:DUF908 domain-containing protein n=1 Tax=Cryptosporidium canis TaxID=195482 RepID=A0ABQ8P5K3_9CRYT|nr:hypothetical protein OIY81_3132 [Cryptosporidium canis]KAJ1609045.1 hypothetical protein OJ252_2331 [Cryptosporidium canis]
MKISIPKGDNYILAVSSLPQSQRELILKLSSDDAVNYDSYLDSFQRWIWDKGDLQCWASVLNRFDDYINSYVIREDLGNAFLQQHLTLGSENPEGATGVSAEQISDHVRNVSEEMMKKILKSTFLILENCTSKSLYASTTGLIALLDSPSPDIVCWSLRTLTTTCSNWKKPKRYIDSETVYHLQMRLSTLCYLPIYTRGSAAAESEQRENEAMLSTSRFYKEETWVNPGDEDLIEVYVPPFICNHYIKRDSDSEERECRLCFDYHKSHILMVRFRDLALVSTRSELEELMRKYKVPVCLKSIINHYIRVVRSYGDKWLRRKWVDVKYTTLLGFPGFSTNNLVHICQVNTTLIPDSIEILEFCHLSIFESNSKVRPDLPQGHCPGSQLHELLRPHQQNHLRHAPLYQRSQRQAPSQVRQEAPGGPEWVQHLQQRGLSPAGPGEKETGGGPNKVREHRGEQHCRGRLLQEQPAEQPDERRVPQEIQDKFVIVQLELGFPEEDHQRLVQGHPESDNGGVRGGDDQLCYGADWHLYTGDAALPSPELHNLELGPGDSAREEDLSLLPAPAE